MKKLLATLLITTAGLTALFAHGSTKGNFTNTRTQYATPNTSMMSTNNYYGNSRAYQSPMGMGMGMGMGMYYEDGFDNTYDQDIEYASRYTAMRSYMQDPATRAERYAAMRNFMQNRAPMGYSYSSNIFTRMGNNHMQYQATDDCINLMDDEFEGGYFRNSQMMNDDIDTRYFRNSQMINDAERAQLVEEVKEFINKKD